MSKSDQFEDVIVALSRLHETEVHAAEQETAGSSGPVRAHTRRSQPSIGLAALVALLIVGALAVRSNQDTQPGSTVASAPPAGSAAAATPSPEATTGPAESSQPSSEASEFPSSVEGQPVLVGSEVVDRAQSGGAASFLAGGWLAFVIADCASQCGSGYVLRLAAPSAPAGSVPSSVSIRLAAGVTLDQPVGRRVVVRVHRDELSTPCSDNTRCTPSVVLDRVVWTGT
jgi:hypothetical protein